MECRDGGIGMWSVEMEQEWRGRMDVWRDGIVNRGRTWRWDVKMRWRGEGES